MAVTLSYNTSNQYESDVMRVYAKFTVGASGAVSAAYGGGVTAIVKEVADGQYSITLGDRFKRVLFVNAMSVDDAAPNWCTATIFEDPATLQTDFQTDSTFKLQLYDETMTAANATSGSQILLEIVVGAGNSPYDSYDIA